MSLYDETVPAFGQMLANLDRWLEAAIAHATSVGFDPENFSGLRLAPDQFPLLRQVQSACDGAKLACARISGVAAPVHADGPATLAELRARIADVRAFLASLPPAAFEGVDETLMSPPFLKGMAVSNRNYIREFAIPNFYFHANMTYAILRNAGVKLGKMDYIGHMTLVKPEA